MSKAELKAANLVWLDTLPADAPEQERIAAIRTGGEQEGAGIGKALTITEAASRAGVSRTLIYRSVAAGALSAVTPYIGGNPRVTEGEIARWLSARKVADRAG